MKEKRARQGYILRYYLPVKPYFDEVFTEQRFTELLDFCKATKTESVMLYVALSPDFYYVSDSPEYAEQVRSQMLPYIERLRENGISYQLNFQNLVGSTLGGVDFSKDYDWENLVDHQGRESLGCGCPIGKKFRAHSEKRLKIWAETKPDVLWIDDDLRMHNHGTPIFAGLENQPGYMDFYCFCDEHIRRFNEKTGEQYTRESLVKEMLQAGQPSQARVEYMRFMNETVLDTAEWIEKTVHSVSPDTRIAQMTSLPDVHAAEGREWEKFLPALCGKHTPMTRPHFGPYRENLPRDFIQCYKMLDQSIAQVREKYDGEVEYCPEVENTRFTVWSKSAAATSYQLALSAFMGCRDITLSLFDLEGGAFFDEPSYKEMLIKQKPFLDKLVGLDLDKAERLGVRIPTSGNSGKNYRLLEGEGYAQLWGAERYIENYLLQMGVPCVYTPADACGGEGVTALDKFTVGFLSDAQLKKILSGSVFIDGGGAEALCRRGFGKYIGLREMQRQSVIVNAEVLKTLTRKDGTYIRIPSRIPVRRWFATGLEDGAKTLSEFLTPDGQKFPALTLYQNELGGKVAIYPAETDWGDGFFTHHRVTLIKDALAELDGGLPRVDAHSFGISAVRKEADTTYYLFANLSADCTDSILINGQEVKEKLSLYQTAVYAERNGELKKIGKTK